MNKFQKLSQINKDIEILETAVEIRAAEIMHRKFIKEAQYMMPQMMMPQMMMPQMMMPQMIPQMMPMMMARPTVAPAAVAKPVATPSPIQQGQVTPPVPQPSPVPPPPPTNKEIKPPYTGTTPPTPNPTDNNQRGYGDKNSKDQEMQYLMNEKKRLEEMGANQPSSPYFKQYQTILEMIKRNQGGSIIKSESMNKFQKLSQIVKDIEILEAAGKIKAAEVLHNKFIKEAQVVVPNRTNYGPSSVNPQQQNYVQRNENSTTSVRDGVSTNYNFNGLDPEMIPVRVQTSPGNYTTVMRPKNNIGNPYATMPSDPNANISGYNEFLKLRPQPSQIRDFIESKGTTTDAGMALFNELSTQKGSKSSNLAPAATPAARSQVKPMAESTNVRPDATPAISVMPTPTNNSAQPVTQDNFKNYYTEQSDTSFYQQQNSIPAEAPVYQQAINQIAGLLNTKNPTNRTIAQQIYENTIGQFKDPKRKQAFANQFQRLVSKNFPGQSPKPGA